MSEERILDALAEAAEAAPTVFRQHAGQARPLWPAERPASRVLDRARDASVYPQVYRLSPALRGGAADARQPRD